MTWDTALLAVAAGLLISTVTAPVGVSGAVFLAPRLPEAVLRRGLGALALALGARYAVIGLT
jgi:uncharacterized membrane protein YfcA